MHHRHGFTLIELSLVLVIIGLLSGVVLVGRQLIETARIRQQVTQIQEMEITVNLFRGKYNCLPGDCLKATEYGLSNDLRETDNGDGNGKINKTALTPSPGMSWPETLNFWMHLSKAGLLQAEYLGYDDGIIGLPGIDTPRLKYPGTTARVTTQPHYAPEGGLWILPLSSELGIQNLFDGKGAHAWFGTNSGDEIWDFTALYGAWVMYQIDAKMDDGLPHSGIVRGYPLRVFSPLYTIMSCVDDDVTPARYRLDSRFEGYSFDDPVNLCTFLVKTSF